jgi:hypothetical protein
MRAAVATARLAVAAGQGEPANGRAVQEAAAAFLHETCQRVFEEAAVELVAGCGQEGARAKLGHPVQVVAAVGEEEAKAELLQLVRLQVWRETEHLAEIVGRDLHRRFADLVGGRRHRMAAPFQDQDVERRQPRLQLQRQGQAGKTAAHDDDVVAVLERFIHRRFPHRFGFHQDCNARFKSW